MNERSNFQELSKEAEAGPEHLWFLVFGFHSFNLRRRDQDLEEGCWEFWDGEDIQGFQHRFLRFDERALPDPKDE